MERVSLKAEERSILGKKVKNLRKQGLLPAHIFGNKVETEVISVNGKNFLKIYDQVGETGLVDLQIGSKQIRPVLIREVSYDPLSGEPLHIDFYQVNLNELVKVAVPLILVGEEPEKVHLGEAIVLQTLNEVEVEAFPTDLPEKIEVDISVFKEIDDAVTISQLHVDRGKITINADAEEIVAKLAPAVSAETQELLEEQAAEQAAAAAEEAAGPEPVEGVKEGEEQAPVEEEAPTEPAVEPEKGAEEPKKE